MNKEFVDAIHDEKAKNDSNSRDLARTLNVLSKTVFGEVNRFIFELLQNADDSSSDGSPISVRFQLLNNYLVFSHNGKHFTKEDVKGISGIGNRASDKDKNVEKTGYKGIGFKSVFGSSNYAHIISGGFSFRFDKNFEGYANAEEYPWQVVPIWTDKVVSEVEGSFDQDWVNTIIGISDRDNIKGEIVKVFEDCQIILFLRKVKSVTLFDRDKKIFEVTKKASEDVVDLHKNGTLESSWIFKIMDLPINDELSEKLNQLSDTECPQKLKEANATKLTFAAQVKNFRLVPIPRAVIYSYLPTKANKLFPFLINGDFLTNAERTELMPNIWNEFLFTEIARRQLEWFRELQGTQYRFDVLKLLNGKYPTHSTLKVDIAYNRSLEAAAGKIDFLPEQSGTDTVVISQSIVDNIGFSEYFSPKLITDYFGITDSHGVVDLRLENQSSLKALGAKQFTFPQMLELVESKVINDTNGAINLIAFFYNKTIKDQNPTWLPQLATTPFIMDELGQYKSPQEIFMPTETVTADINFENLNYVHKDVLTHFEDNKFVFKWLQVLGVREPTDLEVMRKAILPMIKKDDIHEQNRLAITRFIFKVYRAKLLSDNDYLDLKLLKVLTTNGLKIPSHCYLSDYFNPEKKLSTILLKANFLVEDYIETEEDIIDWKMFFKKIGVRENISVDLIDEKIERQKFARLYSEATGYLDWLDITEAYPSLYYLYRNSGQHYIQNYTAIEFRSSLLDAAFSKFFWTKMLDDWEVFKHKCDTTKYYYRGGSTTVPSYIEYFVRTFACIPCTDGKCYKSTEVFAPSLKSIIGQHLPVADLPISMTVGQIEFFKFKKNFSTEECLNLLNLIGSQQINSDTNKQLFSIYDQLISQPTEIVRSLKAKVVEWKSKSNMLTIDNTFEPANKLYIFAVRNAQAPMGSKRFLKVSPSRSRDELKALSEFLEIPMITYDLLEFVPFKIQEDVELKKALMKRAPFLALIYSKKSTENYQKILSNITSIFENTKFINAESLSLVYKDQQHLIVDSKIDCWPGQLGKFYFTGRWNSPLTLYSLSNSLCDLLKLDGMEREFGLAMQLQPDDIYSWLQEQGYPVSEIPEGDGYLHGINTETPEYIADLEDPYADLDIDFENVFTPEVKVVEIDFNNVTAVVNNLSLVSVNTSKEYKSIENSQVKVDIGRWSEEYVNKYLHQNSERFTEINWHNKSTESYLPYDFTVTENGIVKCIEVKGTPSSTKEMIKLSAEEWKQMFAHGNNYSIFRVFGAGTTKSRLERNDNIKDEIVTGKLLDFPMDVYLP